MPLSSLPRIVFSVVPVALVLAGCCFCTEEPTPTCGGYKFGHECQACCSKSNHVGVTVNDRCVCYEKPWEDYEYNTSGEAQRSWDGSEPLVCEGREALDYKNVEAEHQGEVAVIARGRCRLGLENVKLTGKVALVVEDRASVTVRGSELKGSDVGIEAESRAKVYLYDTDVSAPIGVKATTRATMDVSGGSVTGKDRSLDVSGRAQVDLSDVDVKGETKVEGRKAAINGE